VTSSEQTFNMASWEATVRGTRAICKILAAVIVSARGDALLDGDWDAAVQRVRWVIAVSICGTLHAASCCIDPCVLCVW
jgi:hypothetical protein